MPRFDLPDRKGPAQVVLHPEGRERVFPLPYDTEDPADVALLRAFPLLREKASPVKAEPVLPKAPTSKEV